MIILSIAVVAKIVPTYTVCVVVGDIAIITYIQYVVFFVTGPAYF